MWSGVGCSSIEIPTAAQGRFHVDHIAAVAGTVTFW